MKKVSILLVFGLLCLVNLPTSSALSLSDAESVSYEQQVAMEEDLMNCTVSIKGKYFGIDMDLEITVYDVSLFECGLLKVGVLSALPKK